MATLKDRITVDPEQCKGRPCIRDTQIRVADVLNSLNQDLPPEQILAEHPDLELEDIRACLQFASDQLNRPVRKSKSTWIWGGSLFVIVVWGISLALFFDWPSVFLNWLLGLEVNPNTWFSDSQLPDKKGQFGDSFGAVNALFSGLAFVGVIWAIMQQQEEIELQREDLKNTQDEMKEQRGVMQKEVFERSFFQLQQMLDEQYNQIEYGGRRGKDALYQAEHDISTQPGILPDFIPYFYLLFKVFEFVEQSKLEEKKFYIDILCGRVTRVEKSVLSIFVEDPDLDSEFEHRDDSGNSEAFRAWFEKYFKNARE